MREQELRTHIKYDFKFGVFPTTLWSVWEIEVRKPKLSSL